MWHFIYSESFLSRWNDQDNIVAFEESTYDDNPTSNVQIRSSIISDTQHIASKTSALKVNQKKGLSDKPSITMDTNELDTDAACTSAWMPRIHGCRNSSGFSSQQWKPIRCAIESQGRAKTNYPIRGIKALRQKRFPYNNNGIVNTRTQGRTLQSHLEGFPTLFTRTAEF